MAMKFPHVVAAVEARQKHIKVTEGSDLWDIGDALVQDIDRSTSDGRNLSGRDGSRAQIQECAKELEARGYPDYSVSYLSRLLSAAEAFPKSKRRASLTFNAHLEAGNPEILDWVLKAADKAGIKKPSVIYIREMTMKWTDRLEAKRKAKLAEAEAKKKAAVTKAQEDEAEAEIEATRSPPPKREMPAPTEDETPVVLKELDLMSFSYKARQLAAEAKRLAEEAEEGIDGAMQDVSRAFIEAATEAALEAANDLQAAANAWRAVSETTRKTTINKRGHLAAVGA